MLGKRICPLTPVEDFQTRFRFAIKKDSNRIYRKYLASRMQTSLIDEIPNTLSIYVPIYGIYVYIYIYIIGRKYLKHAMHVLPRR